MIPNKLSIDTDAEWAGCKKTPKSTSGGCIVWGQHTIKTWSKTQSLTALSSAESEFYAAFEASAEGLGTFSILKDFGIRTPGIVYGDASAALGIIHRKRARTNQTH